jgi:Phage integrase, N-terminal SAM-like domain
MKEIVLKPLFHRNEECIGIYFAVKGKAEIDQSALHQYLAEKKKPKVSGNQLISVPVKAKAPIAKVPAAVINSLVKIGMSLSTGRIQTVNAHVLPAMRQKLLLKAYSASTIKTYINEMAQLLQTINNIPADALTPEHLRRYLVYC